MNAPPASRQQPLVTWHVETDELVELRPIRALDYPDSAWDDMLAVTLHRPVTDDDDKARVVAAIGYAWAQHGGQRQHSLDQHSITWLQDQTVIVHARLSTRPNKSRTVEQAARDLLVAIDEYVYSGTPERKRLQGRLVDPLDPPVQVTAFHCH